MYTKLQEMTDNTELKIHFNTNLEATERKILAERLSQLFNDAHIPALTVQVRDGSTEVVIIWTLASLGAGIIATSFLQGVGDEVARSFIEWIRGIRKNQKKLEDDKLQMLIGSYSINEEKQLQNISGVLRERLGEAFEGLAPMINNEDPVISMTRTYNVISNEGVKHTHEVKVKIEGNGIDIIEDITTDYSAYN